MAPSGIKHDQGKLRLDLIPPEMIRALGEVLTFGAGKYTDRNWEKGLDFERLYAAAERHLLAWREGETFDPESGRAHLEHAFCTLGMLVTLEARNGQKGESNPDQLIWMKLLDMIQETRNKHDTGFFCPTDTPCRGGDMGDNCKACWLQAALKQLTR